MTVVFDGIPTPFRVLHLPGAETASRDLTTALSTVGLESSVIRIGEGTAEDPARSGVDSRSILAAIAEHTPDLLVIDLPLDAGSDPLLIDRVSGLHPEVALVFRWPEDRSEPAEFAFSNAVRAALERNPDRERAPREHSELLAQVVRQQEVILALSKIDPWEFREAVERVAETLADALEVEQVTIWELRSDAPALRCIDLHRRASGEHRRCDDLPIGPRYFTSLRQSLTISAHDAQNDPRTSEFIDDYLAPAGIRSLLDAPIRGGSEVIGVICHEHVGDDLRWWSVFDRGVASYAASVLSRAFEVRERRRVHDRMHQIDRLRAIGEVAAGIAHDLNNQLGIVLGNLEVAKRAVSDPPSTPSELAVVRAEESAHQVSALIKDLLDIGRGSRVTPETIDLRGWLDGFAPTLRTILPEDIDLEVALPAMSIAARLDRHAGRRILLNLVKNAKEAITRRGTITISTHFEETTEPCAELAPGSYVVVSVRDDGCGMDEETHRRLFEPFHSTKRHRGGTGLGLATSFGLAVQLGGTIGCTTELGVGSCFEWWIERAAEIR